LPWFRFVRGADEMAQVHRLAFELDRANTPNPVQWAIYVFAAWCWPVRAPLLAAAAVLRYGTVVKRTFGVSRARQFAEMAYLAFMCNVTTTAYYRFRLFNPELRRKARLFIQLHEHGPLMHSLNRDGADRVDDKFAFIDFAGECGLPVIEDVLRIECGRRPEGRSTLPRRSLFMKWTDMCCGEGAEKWPYDERTGMWTRGEKTFDEQALVAYCNARAAERPLLVQPCEVNPPSFDGFGASALCTVRVVTLRPPGGAAYPLLAVLRMPANYSDVDNYAAGGVAATINLSTGMIERAAYKEGTRDDVTHHPDTGEPIVGWQVPCWEEVLALAVRGHEALGEPWSIGWDVAATNEGLKLVEANTQWCSDISQAPFQRPIGETTYPGVLLAVARARGMCRAETGLH
jgi:hypothetical protein